jgi:hypothetical protein
MTDDDSKTVNALPVVSTNQDLSAPGLTETEIRLLDEDSALALLQRTDLQPDSIEKLSKNSIASKSRKVKLAIVRHPKSPRHVSLPLIRKLFTFDLMQVALTPVVAGDLKMAAEEVLINRLETISGGERLSLARRASGRVAGALLLDPEPRIVAAALENPHLTEALVTEAVLVHEASPALVKALCTHHKWSLRREIRIALLRNQHTPLDYAVEFAKSLTNDVVREILQASSCRRTSELFWLRAASFRLPEAPHDA